MGFQYVIVQAWVPEPFPGAPGHPLPEPPPGIWGGGNQPFPTPPIQLPPGWASGNPPGIWGGGNVPMPSPPIANVPGAPGWTPGGPPGIWGPNDPRPSNPIQLPPWGWTGERPPQIWGGGNVPMPSPPIHLGPGGGIGGPPGIWGPTDPRPGWGLPGPQPPIGAHPEHPIYYPPQIWGPTDPRPGYGLPGGAGDHIWGGGNVPMPQPPIEMPGPIPPPIFNPDDLPDHPEVPDLNAGDWMWIVDNSANEVQAAFVPWRLAVTHPDYNPNYPPESVQPGNWVVIVLGNEPTNAWVPSAASKAAASTEEAPAAV